jgi:hypothetical protein
MPFNGIQLKFAEYGLCLPGIGYLLYEENTQALWSILVPLLPSTWHEVKAQVMLMRTHHDGYKLLWLLGLTVVKIWSKLHSVPEPCWFVDNTIFYWAQRIQLYDILRRLWGQLLDEKDISLKHLQGVRGKHKSLAQAIAYQLNKPTVPEDDLPSDWTVDTMRIMLNSTVTGSLIDDMQLCSHHFPRGRPVPWAHFLTTDPNIEDEHDNDSNFYSAPGTNNLQLLINTTSLQRSHNQQRQHRGPRGPSDTQQQRPPQPLKTKIVY